MTIPRWYASDKAALIEAIETGAISVEEAMAKHRLSPKELQAWRRDLERHGVRGLRTTLTRTYREEESR